MLGHFDRYLGNQEHHIEVDSSTPDRKPKENLFCVNCHWLLCSQTVSEVT